MDILSAAACNWVGFIIIILWMRGDEIIDDVAYKSVSRRDVTVESE